MSNRAVQNIYGADDTAVASAGTAVNLPNRPTTLGAFIMAPSTNTGNIYIGGAGVTKGDGAQRGMVLMPGGMFPCIVPVANLNLLYVNADTTGDKVSYLVL